MLDYRPLKEEKYRVRITVGGDKLEYPDDVGSPTTNLLDTKVLIKREKGARFMTADIECYFLATPMVRKEYTEVKIKHIPVDIQMKYNLQQTITSDKYYTYA